MFAALTMSIKLKSVIYLNKICVVCVQLNSNQMYSIQMKFIFS